MRDDGRASVGSVVRRLRFELLVLGATIRAAGEDLRKVARAFATAARVYPPTVWRSYREARRRLLELQRWRAEYGADRVARLEHSDEILVNTHRPTKCAGERCPLHRRSNHGLRGWPQRWRSDRGIVERVCSCGIGHPDPDDPTEDRVHGCCGHCSVAARAH